MSNRLRPLFVLLTCAVLAPSLIAPVFAQKNLQGLEVNANLKAVEGGLLAPKIEATIESQPSPFEPIVPELNVKIPGLTFGDIKLEPQGGRVIIPYLAQYIAAIYKYLVGISVIAAAIMITYGGFLYITSSSAKGIGDGKDNIKDALMGLFLVLGATTILYTITGKGEAQLEALRIDVVEKEQLTVIPANPGEFWKAVKKTPSTTPSSTQPPTPEQQQQAQAQAQAQANLPGTRPPEAPLSDTFTDGECTFKLNSIGLPTKFSTYQCGVQMAKKHGISPCWAVVGFNWESKDGMPNSIGYDELAPNNSVQTKNGICSFPKGGTAKCGGKQNNDYLNLDGTKEDLGLDWRYSRGLGMLQVTIFPKSKSNAGLKGQTAYWCNENTPSIMLPPNGGSCFTARDLMSPTKSIEAGIILLKMKIGSGGGDIYKVWNNWGGPALSLPCADDNTLCKRNDAIYAARTEEVKKCLDVTKAPNAPVLVNFMRGATRCRGDAPLSVKACKAENERIAQNNRNLPPDQQQPPYSCNAGCSPSQNYPIKSSQLLP